ncbi:MAG TPA: hypothetical protein VM055_01515, partial [Novosphingobium sp.]|nr:hypothetical protein [Novosphingobium sp.]
SRKRSNVAKWILVTLFALGLPLFIKLAVHGLLLGAGWISALQTVGQALALGLLFTPTARHWLSRQPASEIATDDFGDLA